MGNNGLLGGMMYAWSNIVYGAEQDAEGNYLGQKVVAAGDEVDQGTLAVSDEEWQMLQDQEVVREYELPEDLRDTFRSPRQIMQDKLIAAQQGFDTTGPTADLVKRFDDEGNVLTEEQMVEVATQKEPSTTTPTQTPSQSQPPNESSNP
jgi:hypothetical protein